MLGDLKLALRWLRKSPVFTITATTTLALAIGANAAVTSDLMNTLRPVALPVFAMTVQAPQVVTLSTGVTGPEFLDVVTVRELEDGRTLVVDEGKRALQLVNWSSGQVRGIGRLGDGPGEYRYPGQLIALSADSTILTDHQNGKWHFVFRDRIVSSVIKSEPLLRFVGSRPAGADTLGRLLVVRGLHYPRGVRYRGPGTEASAESLAIVLVDRKSARVDTIARVRGPFLGRNNVTVKMGGVPSHYRLGNPLAVGDQAILFSDGWIAIAFAAPYRVAWRPPTGRIVYGQPLPDPRQPVDGRVKQLAVQERWPPSTHTPRFRVEDFPGWPAVVPPFPREALMALPDGRVAIKRMSFQSTGTVQYDIVDRKGSLSGVLRLPRNERLVGSGKHTVYTVVTDSLENEHLRRHRWP